MSTKNMSTKYIYRFSELDRHGISVVGGKGANLGELVQAKFPVPDGFCVSVDAYRQVVSNMEDKLDQIVARVDWGKPADIEEKSLQIRTLIEEEQVPDNILEEIVATYSRLGNNDYPRGVPVAVRSSATSEDLPEASFAGQQDTYLNVQGEKQLVASVRCCWASLWTARAMSYRQKQGYDHKTVYLSVVVQQMVDSQTAGVAFSVNPLSNNRDEMLITSSYGLGEVVVAGTVIPDVFILNKRQNTCVSRELGAKEKQLIGQGGSNRLLDVPMEMSAQFSLSDSQLKELGNMVRKVEEHYQSPQDIEWAFDQERLYLLQSRPITTLQQDSLPVGPLVAGKLNRLQKFMLDDILEHYPEAPSPLDYEVVTMSYQSILDAGAELGRISPATDIVRLDSDGRIALYPPRIRPTLRTLLLPLNLFKKKSSSAQVWFLEKGEKLSPLVKDIMEEELSGENSQVLLEQLAELFRWAKWVCDIRFYYILQANLIPMVTLSIFLKLFCPAANRPVVIDLITTGLDYKTAIIDREINKVALLAGGQPEVKRAVLNENNSDLSKLDSQIGHLPEGADFLEQVGDFLNRYGYRTEKMYQPFSSVSWLEEPARFLVILRAVVQDPSLKDWMAKERERKVYREIWLEEFLQKVPNSLRKLFLRAYNGARENHLIREDTLFVLEGLFTAARRLTGELGRRLANEGQLRSPEDIIFLTREEIALATIGGSGQIRYYELAAKRKKMSAINQALWTEALMDLSDNGENGGELKGKVGSPGIAEGPVRVIMGVADFGKLKKGDILVCPYTDPTWTPLFGLASAVVADTGGPLSHAAIVAREYGIPAILATKCGTRTFVDGEAVVVNGMGGTVYRSRIKEKKPARLGRVYPSE